jgi:hypothetical protein
MKVLLGMFLMLAVTSLATADTGWTHAGNTRNGFVFSDQSFEEPDCNCVLNGTVTLDSSRNPVARDFTDGTHTLTKLNSTGFIKPFELSSTPLATRFISLSGGGIRFWSENSRSAGEATAFSAVGNWLFGYEEGNRGAWPDPVATAEPATGVLVGLGLAVVSLIRRRKKKLVDRTVWENLG